EGRAGAGTGAPLRIRPADGDSGFGQRNAANRLARALERQAERPAHGPVFGVAIAEALAGAPRVGADAQLVAEAVDAQDVHVGVFEVALGRDGDVQVARAQLRVAPRQVVVLDARVLAEEV